VVTIVLGKPDLFDVLFQGLENSDPILRMRCADAIEKITVCRPELLAPYRNKLIGALSKIEQQEVRWHVAPLLTRLQLSRSEEAAVIKILLSYTNDRSSILKTMAIQALADIAIRNPRYLAIVEQRIAELQVTGTPAVKSRCKSLLQELKRDRSSWRFI
jgi:hypothetical protein